MRAGRPQATAATSGGQPGGVDYGLLFLLASLWGASFLLIKVGVEAMSPAMLTAWRLVLAAGVMWVALLTTGQRIPTDRSSLVLMVIVAVLGNVIPFNLISWGQIGIESGLTAIIMGVMPLTTMLLAHLVIADDRMTPAKVIGVTLGFAGVLVLVGPTRLVNLGDETVRQLAIALAAFFYGASAVATRRLMASGSGIGLATGIMTLAATIMVPFVVAAEGWPSMPADSGALAAIVCLGVVQTGFAQILLFRIVERQGASFFSQINFLVPVLGVFWGALVLGERLPVTAFVALALIMLGVGATRLRLWS